ncbi:MAG: ROK family protein [Thermoprotei archaeon]|nr:MAG: ROK family protein [Thermoprotei archaeon]HDD64467.1 ROK family protein [Thermoprotei archaeon]
MYIIGVDIGATYTRVALADNEGKILDKVVRHTVREGEGILLTRQIIDMIREVSSRNHVDFKMVKGIGIGTIGPLDLKKGVITKPANLPLGEVPLRNPLREEFKVDVYILNDAVAGAVAEKFFGKGREYKNVVYVTISTGIGCGVFVDGNLLLGKDGNAHEMGHIVVDLEGRLKCGCGQYGHWEAYASGSGIPKFARLLISEMPEDMVRKSLLYRMVKGDFSKLNAKHVYDAAREGDKVALKIVDEVGRINAIGIANVITAYDPSIITIGGSVALNNVDLVLNPIRKHVGKYTVNRVPRIEITELGGDIVLIGAVATVVNELNTIPED